jgi:hypothetical protein
LCKSERAWWLDKYGIERGPGSRRGSPAGVVDAPDARVEFADICLGTRPKPVNGNGVLG